MYVGAVPVYVLDTWEFVFLFRNAWWVDGLCWWVMAANTPVNGSQLVHIIPCRTGIFAPNSRRTDELVHASWWLRPNATPRKKIDKYEVHAAEPHQRHARCAERIFLVTTFYF